ncbi:MAG: c-type cytochrome [Pseudohongiellaceae bacterium]
MKPSLPPAFYTVFISLILSSCASSGANSPDFDQQFRPPPFRDTDIDDQIMAKWSRSCALCHITGEAGAPIVGDTLEWQRRLQQGEQAVLNNVLDGYNSMPPLGYCMACEISDFRAMIAYMAGEDR